MNSLVSQAIARAARMRRPEVVRLPATGPVLLFAPHPDDEVLGAGGTLRKHVEAGDAVWVCFVTDGRRGGKRGSSAEATVERRRQEAEEATSCIGARIACFLDAPDGALTPTDVLVARVRSLVLEIGPRAIYVPNFGEQHRDHLLTAVLVAEALRGCALSFDLLAYEVWTPLQPNCVVNITHQMEHKLSALACYGSQLEQLDYSSSARALAAYRAILLPSPESRFAEAFWRGSAADFTHALAQFLSAEVRDAS